MKKLLLSTLCLVGSAFVASADLIVTTTSVAPVQDGADIANYVAGSGGQAIFPDRPNQGISFQTAGDPSGYTLYGVSIQLNNTSDQDPDPLPADKVWTLRLVTLDGIVSTTVRNETGHTSTGSWSAGDWYTWTFDTPVDVDGGTWYGVDLEMTSGGAWQRGIPNFRNGDNDGDAFTFRYTHPDGDSSTYSATTSDLVFHLDLAPASVIPEPSTAALLLLAGVGLLRRLRRG